MSGLSYYTGSLNFSRVCCCENFSRCDHFSHLSWVYPSPFKKITLKLSWKLLRYLKTKHFNIFLSFYSQIMILLTTGKQTGQQSSVKSLQEASEPLRNKGIKIYVVAVGNKEDIDEDELIEIAGARENVITAESYDQLVNLAEEISKVACGTKIEFVLSIMISKSL